MRCLVSASFTASMQSHLVSSYPLSMKYSFLLPVACSLLLQVISTSAQTTQPIATGQTPTSPVPVQLACRSFSGHVKSDAGTPLVGATVMVKGTYVARTTNDEGFFTFDLPSVPTQAPHLMVSSAGFGPQEFLITSCEPLAIELKMLEGTRIKKRGKHKGFIKQAGKG